MNWDDCDRRGILEALERSDAAGEAAHERDTEFWPRYLPIPEHLRAFERNVVLVLGHRGAGKSELFRAFFTEKGLTRVRPHAPRIRFPEADPEHMRWLPAYPAGPRFPDASSMQRLFGQDLDSDQSTQLARKLWFAHLVREVKNLLDAPAQKTLSELLQMPGGSAIDLVQALDRAGDQALLALDRLDQRMITSKGLVCLGYDELDLLGDGDWGIMQAALRGLIGCWTSYARRWQGICAKIFLRTDLFVLHGHRLGADLPKLAANRVDLEWTDRLLYATLVKRLVNCHQDLAKVAKSCKVNLVRDDHLGLIPRFEDEAELRPFVEAVAGSFMGSNRRKGQTWLWLLDHVRDGRRQASPRSLGSLLARAAQEELLHPRADASRLLHPVALRTALDQVSALEIRRITEFPWLDGLKKRLQGKEIPADRRRIIGWLQHDWEAWQKNRPPAEDAKGFLENLLELGVLRDRGGDRLDVPDLYMAGLEMKRRGGVKRR